MAWRSISLVLFCRQSQYSSERSGGCWHEAHRFYLGDLVDGQIDNRCCQQRTRHVVVLGLVCSNNTGTLARYITVLGSEFPWSKTSKTNSCLCTAGFTANRTQ